MTSNDQLSLLIVSRHPAQTHIPLYRELARFETINLFVLYFKDTTKGFVDSEFNQVVEWVLTVVEI